MSDDFAERLIATMVALGDTADDVARSLVTAGARGERKKCDLCPVARYLTGAMSSPISCGLSTALPIGRNIGMVPIPAPLAAFIVRFDEGQYPELCE